MAPAGYIGSAVSKVASNSETIIKYIIWRKISQLSYSSHILYINIYVNCMQAVIYIYIYRGCQKNVYTI